MIQWGTHIVLKKAEPECNQASRVHFQFQEIQVREKHNPYRKTDPSRMWGTLQTTHLVSETPQGCGKEEGV